MLCTWKWKNKTLEITLHTLDNSFILFSVIGLQITFTKLHSLLGMEQQNSFAQLPDTPVPKYLSIFYYNEFWVLGILYYKIPTKAQ